MDTDVHAGHTGMDMDGHTGMDMDMSGNDTDHNMMMHMSGMHMMMMRMTFYFGSSLPTGLLFDSWKVTNDPELVGAFIAVFFMAFFYDGLKTLREFLVSLDVRNNSEYLKKSGTKPTAQEVKKMEAQSFQQEPNEKSTRGWFLTNLLLYFQWVHFLQSFLHVVQTGWSYLLMLIAMTYNGWLFLAVCLGAGLGYFVFARFRFMLSCPTCTSDQMESCH